MLSHVKNGYCDCNSLLKLVLEFNYHRYEYGITNDNGPLKQMPLSSTLQFAEFLKYTISFLYFLYVPKVLLSTIICI